MAKTEKRSRVPMGKDCHAVFAGKTIESSKRRKTGARPAREHDERRLREVESEARHLEKHGRLGETRAFSQHGDTSVYDHVVSVALESARFADALEKLGVEVDRRALIRGALLHDYFLYDWHDLRRLDRIKGYTHPFIAAANASEDFALSERERNIITRHMFPLVPLPPTCREAWIVTAMDKYCALKETIVPRRDRIRELLADARGASTTTPRERTQPKQNSEDR